MKSEIPLFIVDSSRKHKTDNCDIYLCVRGREKIHNGKIKSS